MYHLRMRVVMTILVILGLSKSEHDACSTGNASSREWERGRKWKKNTSLHQTLVHGPNREAMDVDRDIDLTISSYEPMPKYLEKTPSMSDLEDVEKTDQSGGAGYTEQTESSEILENSSSSSLGDQ